MWSETRLALRQLRRSPGFSITAIAVLALGIGATSTMFNVVDGVLLKPLAHADPDRLAMVWTSAGSRVSADYFDEWRTTSGAFDDMAAWFEQPATLTGPGEPVEVAADRVTSNFFAVLATPALMGRWLTTEGTLREAEPEAVMSYGLWQRRFGSDPAIIGRSLAIDGQIVTIVGVMPRAFAVRTLEHASSRAELWMPFALVRSERGGMGGRLNVVGRLASAASIDQARADLTAIAQRLEAATPSYSRTWTARVVAMHEATVKDARLALLVAFAAVGLLLLTACVNVANLVLVRATSRERDVAVRRSLGATTRDLVRGALAEAAVLAGLGGVAGALLAVQGTQLALATLPAAVDLPRTAEITMSLRGTLLAVVIACATLTVVGLLPHVGTGALRSAALTDRGGTASRREQRWRHALVVSEIAASMVLLAAAGLVARSFVALQHVDAGFQADQVVTLRTTLPRSEDRPESMRDFNREVLERLAQVPGVALAGSVGYLPMAGVGRGGPFQIEGRPSTPGDVPPGSWTVVAGGRYFDAMGIPLRRGRLPDHTDSSDTPPVVVIDELLASRYWPNQDPVGARVLWRNEDATVTAALIIGVVGNVRWAGMSGAPPAVTYFWFPQRPEREMTFVVRTSSHPAGLGRQLAAAVSAIRPTLPVTDVRTMDDVVSADLAQPRVTLWLVAGFAGAAAAVTLVGLYGIMVFSIGRRTREFGIRAALGAGRGDLVRLVMGQGLALVGLGLAVGLGGALAAGRLIEGLLFGVSPADPAALMGASGLLGVAAALAIYVPARRATGVEPLAALKAE